MIIRCQLCSTPIFELRKVGEDAIIILKARHHSEEHISLVNIRELLERLEKGESLDDPGDS